MVEHTTWECWMCLGGPTGSRAPWAALKELGHRREVLQKLLSTAQRGEGCDGSQPAPLLIGSITAVAQTLSCVQLLAAPRTAACQASLPFTISQSVLKPMSIESVMPSSHLIPSPSLLPSVFPEQHQTESFPMSQLVGSHGQIIGASASNRSMETDKRKDKSDLTEKLPGGSSPGGFMPLSQLSLSPTRNKPGSRNNSFLVLLPVPPPCPLAFYSRNNISGMWIRVNLQSPPGLKIANPSFRVTKQDDHDRPGSTRTNS